MQTIHLHRVEPPAVQKALDKVITEWKYVRQEVIPVPPAGPSALPRPLDPGPGHVCYLLGPRRGNWLTLIQTFQSRDDAPFLADLANRLSDKLQTHTLALLLHEGLLFYNLDYRGTPRDGYVSNPHFLADAKLTDEEVLKQRHQPKAFTPLLPNEVTIDQLQSLLNQGWWHAYDAQQLDEHGEPLQEESLVDEEERLTSLGQLLQLNGQAGYPFAHWPTTKLIDWKSFQALYYIAKGRPLPLL